MIIRSNLGCGPPASLIKELSDRVSREEISTDFDKLEIEYVPELDLPKTRIERKLRRLKISIPCPLVAEHQARFWGEDPERLVAALEPELRDLPTSKVCGAVLDAALEAVKVLRGKLKGADSFEAEKIYRIAEHLRSLLNDEDLLELDQRKEEERQQLILDTVENGRARRRAEVRPLDTRLRDLRVYSSIELKPYDYRYTEIFFRMLEAEDFRCPGYSHIFLSVGPDRERALDGSYVSASWAEYGIAVLDAEAFESATEEVRDSMVFTAIVEGLRDIAEVDHLDREKLQRVIQGVAETRTDTELCWRYLENKTHELIVSYRAEAPSAGSPFFINLLEKATQRQARFEFGRADHLECHWRYHKVQLLRDRVRIAASDGRAATVWLEKEAPLELEFLISEIFDQHELTDT